MSRALYLMKRGDIPTVRIGNAIRVLPGDLDKYIQERHSNNESTIFIHKKP